MSIDTLPSVDTELQANEPTLSEMATLCLISEILREIEPELQPIAFMLLLHGEEINTELPDEEQITRMLANITSVATSKDQ